MEHLPVLSINAHLSFKVDSVPVLRNPCDSEPLSLLEVIVCGSHNNHITRPPILHRLTDSDFMPAFEEKGRCLDVTEKIDRLYNTYFIYVFCSQTVP